MRRILVLAGLVLVVGAASAQQYVQGYVRADGTYVEGYYRSAANNTTADNYSSRGNVNPYTGQRGTVDPYTQQPSLYAPAQSSPRPQPRYHQTKSAYSYDDPNNPYD